MISLALGLGVNMGGSSGFDPSSVFAGNAAGMWLDQSDITTGFQDSVGTTPQTASGQQTGLRLDKRFGLARGPELFSTSTTVSSASTGTAVVAYDGPTKTFTVTSTGTAQVRAGLNLGLTIGKTYLVSMSLTGPYTQLQTASASGPVTTASTYTGYIVAADPALWIINPGGSNGGLTIGGTLVINSLSVKLVDGNHVLQATGSARPEWDVIGNISSDFCDGLDDGYSTATFVAGTLTSNMDCFITMKRATTAQMVTCSNGSPNFFGVIQAGGVTAGSAAAVVGAAWTCFVNAVEVGAGPNTASRDGLNTAMGSGVYKVMEFRNLDLSAWTGFTISLYASFLLNADIAQIVLCPAQSTAVRNQIRTYCGAKGGLSL